MGKILGSMFGLKGTHSFRDCLGICSYLWYRFKLLMKTRLVSLRRQNVENSLFILIKTKNSHCPLVKLSSLICRLGLCILAHFSPLYSPVKNHF